jgi:hypothetical protein
MSSGISIEGRLKPAPTSRVEAGFPGPSQVDASRPDNGFQPWHFFVLASILLATVAVVLTRRSSPEHLILLSFTIASAGAVAAALYRTVLPLMFRNPTIDDGPLTDRRRAALERDKMLTLRAIKDLEFDRAMGKLSQKDFDEMSARLRQRALALMKQLDQDGVYRAVIERDLEERLKSRPKPGQPAFARDAACACGTINDADAVFCKKCGVRLGAS